MRVKTIWLLIAVLTMAVAGCGGSTGGQGSAIEASFVVLQAEEDGAAFNVSGIVFNDVDGDGEMDTCEPGIEGVEVTLLDGENTVVGNTDTDIFGQYYLFALVDGEYTVEANASDDYDPINSIDVTVPFEDPLYIPVRTTVQSYSICGTVFEDANGNKFMDTDEFGMADVEVALSENGVTFTNALGTYAFAVTVNSAYSYTLGAIEPEGFMSTTENPLEIVVPQDVFIEDSLVLLDFGLREYIEAFVDVKPGSNVNPFNFKSQGVLPVAILGSDVLDVNKIDPDSILINGVPPLRWNVGDVCEDEECEEGEMPDDDNPDLLLKFDTQAIADALQSMDGYPDLTRGSVVTLDIVGELIDQTALVATPPVQILIVQMPKD